MSDAPAVHALLIGVDRYLPPKDGVVDGFYPNLKGAVGDANRVEAWLRDDWDVPPRRIEKLLAPLGGGEPPESSPTYENMVAAFERLRSRARSGDHVWIHYSGHGGRVPTQYRELKLRDVDEALVPTNVGDSEARYLRDLELAYLLEQLVESGLKVTVVLDCCHSGGAFRRGDDPEFTRQRRGTEHVDRTRRPEKSGVAPATELRRNWRRVRKSYNRSLVPAAGWHFEPRGYVLIAACRAHEQAFEETYDGACPSGALTHWLLDSARALPRKVTYRQLFDRVRANVGARDLGQTPQLEGASDTLLLATSRVDSISGVIVLEIDPESGKVLLDAGQAQGARTGTRWAVHAPGSREPGRPVAHLDLVEVGAVSSWAVPVHGGLDRIEPGAPAVLLPRASKRAGRVRTVRLREELSPRPEELEKLRRAIADDGFLEVLADDDSPDEPADFEVAATQLGYEIFGRGGEPLHGVDPIPFGRAQAERFASWNLVHLARFHDVVEHSNDDEHSPLHRGLELSLHRLAGPTAGFVDPASLVALSDPPELRAGDWVCLKLANRSYQVLNVTVFDLRFSDWQIVRIFPREARFQSVEPDEEIFLPFEVERPEHEVIKAFGTVDATDFDGLQLPAIGRPGLRQYRSLAFSSMEWTACDLVLGAAPNGG